MISWEDKSYKKVSIETLTPLFKTDVKTFLEENHFSYTEKILSEDPKIWGFEVFVPEDSLKALEKAYWKLLDEDTSKWLRTKERAEMLKKYFDKVVICENGEIECCLGTLTKISYVILIIFRPNERVINSWEYIRNMVAAHVKPLNELIFDLTGAYGKAFSKKDICSEARRIINALADCCDELDEKIREETWVKETVEELKS